MSADTPSTEPVDAEFEPAPGSAQKKTKPRKAKPKGAGLLTLIGITLLSSTVAGGTGWLFGRYLPGPQNNSDPALLSRLEALEGNSVEPALASLDSRINTLETEATAQTLRAQALEQLIRDVATLRDQVADFNTTAPDPTFADVDFGPINTALSELESQLTALDNRLSAELNTVRATASTAQSAVQQILSQGQTPNTSPMDLNALSAVQADLTSLSQTFEGLQERIAALETSEVGNAGSDLAPLLDRINTIEARLTAQVSSSASPINEDDADLVRRALAFSELAEAAARSQSFAMEYAMLSQVWPDAPDLIALRAAARDGAPTISELAIGFPADAIRQASGETQRWLGVIEVRRTGDDGGTASEIERLLNEGNLAGAMDMVDTIQSEDARLALASWIEGAQSRLALDAILDEWRTVLANDAETET